MELALTQKRASENGTAHIEATTENNIDLASSHLEIIISIFHSLPDECQRAVRLYVEALAALAA